MWTSHRTVMRRVFIFFVFLLGVSWISLCQATEKNMPSFSLPGVDDSPQVVSSVDYQGQVLLVNFWATWCPPCRREIPSLARLQKENKDKGFTVIGISMDKSAKDKIASFAKKIGVNYPVAIGTNEVARSFGALGAIPSSFLVDRKGQIIKKYPGYTTYEKMAKDVEEVLN